MASLYACCFSVRCRHFCRLCTEFGHFAEATGCHAYSKSNRLFNQVTSHRFCRFSDLIVRHRIHWGIVIGCWYAIICTRYGIRWQSLNGGLLWVSGWGIFNPNEGEHRGVGISLNTCPGGSQGKTGAEGPGLPPGNDFSSLGHLIIPGSNANSKFRLNWPYWVCPFRSTPLPPLAVPSLIKVFSPLMRGPWAIGVGCSFCRSSSDSPFMELFCSPSTVRRRINVK